MFALHYYKPTPIYVMDEINAALDFKNVKRSVNEVASEHAVYISAEVKEEDRGSRISLPESRACSSLSRPRRIPGLTP